MTPAIRVENLSKQFRIGARQDGYMTLRESLSHAAAAPWRKLRKIAKRLNSRNGARGHNGYAASPDSLAPSPSSDTIWALKDVSFDVQPGEVVGIIGRNGAGKSTLLKILSRITEPTSGRIQLNGRVASLLEVGTGFHPELTGRENIYLNGAILGMTRREIQRKFDEIVDFAEIDQFIDTPVKRYSSGMYVRLAFAVAAHLEPEMLVVDEVLAVGDAAFQKKCLGKMHDVSAMGRTVLFVSHNTAAIQSLCTSTIVLTKGRISFAGPTDAGVAAYLSTLNLQSRGIDRSAGTPHQAVCGISISAADRRPTDRILAGDPMNIRLSIDPQHLPRLVNFQLTFYADSGAPLFVVATHLSECGPLDIPETTDIVCRIDEMPLAPGEYLMALTIGAPYCPPVVHMMPAVRFEVAPSDFYGNGATPHAKLGHFLVRSAWSDLPIESVGR
jgi:lipopolysaccharide transport system ATP-binding protein